MKASIAGAPVSFGVFELTRAEAETIAADDLLRVLADAGYDGIDLGPIGYLGRGESLITRLRRFGLDLSGGWIQLPLTDDDAFDAALPQLDDALRIFSLAAASSQHRLPLPTLADDGSLARRLAPGRGAAVDPIDPAAWERLRTNAARAASRVRAEGFEPTFHHHAGTYVESADEIDRFLADVDIDLTLDTGHLVVAGADPIATLQRWSTRINHVHLKDVDHATLSRALTEGGGMREVWSSGAFVALGEGDMPLAQFMRLLHGLDYEGWIVVEQDVLDDSNGPLEHFIAQRTADQRSNRAALDRWV